MVRSGTTVPLLWVGNHPATDLCNTEPVIEGDLVELLPDLDAVAAWVVGAGVHTEVDPGTIPASEHDATIEFVHRLRGATRAVLESDAPGGRPLAALNRLLGEDAGVRRVVLDDGDPITFVGADAASQFRLDMATAVVDVFRHDRTRVRRCGNPACVLLFLDVSKSGRRRWCDMTTCGNRAKVAAHYARTSGRDARDGREREGP